MSRVCRCFAAFLFLAIASAARAEEDGESDRDEFF
jgi:hypothetical protein